MIHQIQPHEIALFNFMDKLLPHLTDEFETSYKNKGAISDFTWMPAVLNYEDDPHYKSTSIDHGTMGPTPVRQELKSLPLAQTPDSVTADVTQGFYGEQIVVSADYMYYADGRTELTTTLMQKIREFAMTALKRERVEAMNLFANAFTTANGYQTWESKALCALAHANQHAPTGVTWDNVGTAAFSYAALEAVDNSSTFTVGPDNLGVSFNFNTVIHGPALTNTVRKVLETIQEPGGNDNDINLFRGGWRQVIVPDMQDDILANGDTMWFLQDPQQHSMFMKWGKRPRMQIVRAENGRDLAYQLEFDLVANWWKPYGMYGSNGTV